MFPLAALCEIARHGKRGGDAAIDVDRIASAVIPVEVGVDDGVDCRRIDRNAFGAFGKQHPLPAPGVVPPAAAGFDEDTLARGFDEVAVEGGGNSILLVGGDKRVPKGLRDDAEESSAIPPVDARSQEVN